MRKMENEQRFAYDVVSEIFGTVYIDRAKQKHFNFDKKNSNVSVTDEEAMTSELNEIKAHLVNYVNESVKESEGFVDGVKIGFRERIFVGSREDGLFDVKTLVEYSLGKNDKEEREYLIVSLDELKDIIK